MTQAAALEARGQAPELPSEPVGALAVALLAQIRSAGRRGMIHIARSERRAEEIARLFAGLAPDLEVLVLPPWDCLPYDSVSPSRETMGRRISVLLRLATTTELPRLVVTTPDALLQRIPPREVWTGACFRLEAGGPLDLMALSTYLERTGYILDERVDEPGEAAIRGGAVDLFAAGGPLPYRLHHEDGRITAIHCFDPATQRTLDEIELLTLGPASEVILPPGEGTDRFRGIEHWLPEFYPHLETLFDYLPDAALTLEPDAEDRRAALSEQIHDAYHSRKGLPAEARAGRRSVLPPERLYLEEAEWSARLQERDVANLRKPDGGDAVVPRFAIEADSTGAFAAYLQERLESGDRAVLAGASARDVASLARRAERRLGRKPEPVADWEAVLAAPAGSLLSLVLDLSAGFRDEIDNVTVVAAADLLGSRAESASHPDAHPWPAFETAEFQLGDAVIHIDHGMAALNGVESVPLSDDLRGDAVRLGYAGEATLMVPVEHIDRIWRYGSDAGAVSLDRLDGDSWRKRRAKIEADLLETASRLIELSKAREALSAPKLTPPRRAYERFVARFPFAETADQALAIRATLEDLARERPMDRLICGDVGFGKTEVALRAAAAVALSGKQVAIVAPTTVLARQHAQTFARRFAGLGIEVGHLSRLVTSSQGRAVRKGLADGSIQIAVGTHALASKSVRFKDLGLVIIDEEQRFGTRQKEKLRALARNGHVLTLTATPIPRTLQAALVGLQQISIIATPPARRQPIRTFLSPYDPAAMRDALMRERRRGGQSFVVCPHIADLEPMAARLSELVPELDVAVAHSKMPADEIDDTMVRFADGESDVLLATNIIESGLDVPRANTMLIWRADRFGLSQLHQLRGRVGRGRVRGIVYLLTDAQAKIAPKTEERLRTLESLDRLGAGFAISARDLDLRGAGNLTGEEQAGHVKLLGADLYRRLLERALLTARGTPPDEDWSPEVSLGLSGVIPEDYVPEPELRINLYARLCRLSETGEIEAFSEELEDRFGTLPEPVLHLMAQARIRNLCRRIGVANVTAGPQAIALTFRHDAREDPTIARLVQASGEALVWKGERLILACAGKSSDERLQMATHLLRRLSEA